MKQEQSKTAAGGQRSVSYGELAELQRMFREQADALGVDYSEEPELKEQALADFIDQYIDGSDSPQLRLTGRESLTNRACNTDCPAYASGTCGYIDATALSQPAEAYGLRDRRECPRYNGTR